MARPENLISAPAQQRARAAHEVLDSASGSELARSGRSPLLRGLRALVRESWARSLAQLPEPRSATAHLVLDGAELRAYRDGHPLAALMPVFRRLLVQPCQGSGVLVAVGDQHGRLLWVEGDTPVRRRAEGMLFAPGTDWSEATVGTTAPGTALVVGQAVQIAGAEHFSPVVGGWSCTAVPIRDPDTGQVLGVVDLTGRDEAVAPHTMALVQAAVAAAEAELALSRVSQRTGTTRSSRGRAAGTALARGQRVSLAVLGLDGALVRCGERSVVLSLRHSEILTMLATHPRGVTLDHLADLVNPGLSATTLRAEMVRLRRVLGSVGPDLVPQSRPYRLPVELTLDATQVLHLLARGAHRQAMQLYQGPVLLTSAAPGVIRLRAQVSAALREAVLSDGSAESLLRFLELPDASDDAPAWFEALRRLPARSPRRAAVVAHLERLEADLR